MAVAGMMDCGYLRPGAPVKPQRPATPSQTITGTCRLTTAPLIVFDLDGTLVDTLDNLTASANRLLGRYRRAPVDAAAVRTMVGDGVPALVRRVLTHAALDVDEASAINTFTRDYERHAACSSKPFPGTMETLLALHRNGWSLAVCTNKPQTAARTLLTALGITPLLAAVGGGDSFATRKPDPGHLLATIECAGGAGSRAVLVGDHFNDVLAARGAGIPCIFALWGYGRAEMAGNAACARSILEVPHIAEALIRPDERRHAVVDAPS